MEWKPIETYNCGSEVVVIVCEGEEVYPAIYQKWIGRWTHPTESSIDYNPTHWMQLPDPPKCK